jgi:hypothetical protein
LLIPLAVFVVSEMLIATYLERTDITSEWAIHAFLPRPAVVYVTFIVVLGFVLNEEGRAKVTTRTPRDGMNRAAGEQLRGNLGPTAVSACFRLSSNIS